MRVEFGFVARVVLGTHKNFGRCVEKNFPREFNEVAFLLQVAKNLRGSRINFGQSFVVRREKIFAGRKPDEYSDNFGAGIFGDKL